MEDLYKKFGTGAMKEAIKLFEEDEYYEKCQEILDFLNAQEKEIPDSEDPKSGGIKIRSILYTRDKVKLGKSTLKTPSK